MKAKREICEQCSHFHNGVGKDGIRYAFCYLDDEKHLGWQTEFVKNNPKQLLESDFFNSDRDESWFDLCEYKTEYCLKEWNEKKS